MRYENLLITALWSAKQTKMKHLIDDFYHTYGLAKDWLSIIPPFDLREKLGEDYEDEDDLIFDLPYAYTTDKNGYFIIHLVIIGKNKDNDFIGFGTGEEWGEEFILSIDDIPVESVFQIIGILTND